MLIRFVSIFYFLGLFRLKTYSLSESESRGEDIHIVICLWKRIDRVPDILKQLSSQKTTHNIKVYFWNNRYFSKRKVKRYLTNWQEELLNSSVNEAWLTNSLINVGGFGRFFLARKLLIKNKIPYVIFLDDDQVIDSQFVNTCMKYRHRKHIYSFWAFKIFETYSDRVRVKTAEELADYCGTGGMVTDTEIFKQMKVFTCPTQYWFIEDLWLSFIARNKGWKLSGLPVEIEFVDSENDQGIKLNEKKHHFYDLLKRGII